MTLSGLSRVSIPGLSLGASATGGSTLNVPHGTAPSSPVNGDIWTTSAGLYVRINGTTVGPLNTNGPATTVTTLTGLQSAVVGTSTLYARGDHQHAVAGVVDTSTAQSVGGAKSFTADIAALTAGGVGVSPLSLQCFAASVNYPVLRFTKSRNASVGSHTVVPLNETLGIIGFYGSDGTAYQAAAGIYGRVAATGTISATSMPGSLEFATSADGSVTPVARLSIDQAGTTTVQPQGAAGTKSLVVERSTDTTPTANIQEWQTAAGSALAYVNKDGNSYFGNRLWLGDGGGTPSTYNGPTAAGAGLLADSTGNWRLWAHNGTVAALAMSGSNAGAVTSWGAFNILAGIQGNSGFGGAQTFTVTAAGVGTISPATDVVPLTLKRGTDSSPTADIQKWANAAGTTLASVTSLGQFKLLTGTTSAAPLNFPSGSAPSTPAAGDTWATSSGFYHSTGVASNTTRIPGTVNFSRCTSDSSAATTGTYVIPTGFPSTIPLKSGRTYRVEVVGFYQCAATTYAPRHRLSYPTLTAGSITMHSFSGASTSTQTGSAVTLGASPTTFVSANAGGANTSYFFRLDGFIIPSADGNLIYDFTPNAAGTMRIMAGTFISVTEVG